MASAPPIPDAERIPLPQKIGFSIGVNTEFMATGLLTSSLWMPYFNIGMGISPSRLTIILAILLTWGACMDPLLGNISDNLRTRWGRRRPLIAAGAVLTGCLYPLFWYLPDGWSENGKVCYLLVLGLIYFTCYSMWSMPYYGLQMELTPNYDERTRLASWMALFGKIATLLGGWVLAFSTSHLFLNPETGKGDVLIGMKTVCWIIAGAILIFGLWPAFSVRERYYKAEASKQEREPFWKSVQESARNGPLWCLIGIMFFMVLGTAAVASLTQYINIYYVFGGDLPAASYLGGWKNTVLVVTGIGLIPFWTWLGSMYDKKSVLLAMIIFTLVGHCSNYFCIRPDMPYLQIVSAIFESATISAVWLFLPSMKADTADYDELHTGRRREGAINSFFSCFYRASLTTATALGGFVLEFSGFTAKIKQQPPEVLQRMFWLFLILPICIQFIAVLIGLYYPLSRQKMAEIRAALEARRGTV